MLEVASVDPRQGVVFYTLDQERTARRNLKDVTLACSVISRDRRSEFRGYSSRRFIPSLRACLYFRTAQR